MKWLFCQQAFFPNRVINFLVTFPRSYNPTIELNAETFLWCIGCHNIRQFLLVWRGDFIQTYFDRDAHAFYSILCVYSSFSRASYVKLLQCPQLLHLIFSVSSMLFLLLLLIFLLHFEFDSRECITWHINTSVVSVATGLNQHGKYCIIILFVSLVCNVPIYFPDRNF